MSATVCVEEMQQARAYRGRSRSQQRELRLELVLVPLVGLTDEGGRGEAPTQELEDVSRDHRLDGSVGVERGSFRSVNVRVWPRSPAEGVGSLPDELGPSNPNGIALQAFTRLQHLDVFGEQKELGRRGRARVDAGDSGGVVGVDYYPKGSRVLAVQEGKL